MLRLVVAALLLLLLNYPMSAAGCVRVGWNRVGWGGK